MNIVLSSQTLGRIKINGQYTGRKKEETKSENSYPFQYVFFRGRGTSGKQLKPYTTTFEVP